MGSKKKTDNQEKKVANSPLLSYEEYCAILKLAQKIRKEKKDDLKKATEPKDKTNLLEQIFSEYQVPGNASSDQKEREHAIVLKVNIFIPDSEKFLSDYKNLYDKNIRLISEAYKIPAPFAINKVAELSKYEKYQQKLKSDDSFTIEEEAILDSIAEDVPKFEEQNPSPTIKNDTQLNSEDILTAELSRHLGSIEGYCTRLISSNYELGKENVELKKMNALLQEENKKTQAENANLAGQITVLKEQLNDHSVEDNLRRQIEELKAANAELKSALIEQKNEAMTSHNRAVQATMQLDQFRAQMNSLADEVFAIGSGEINLNEQNHMKM